MDLNAITTISRPRSRAEIEPFADGDAWLAGGTWLFSEPQPRVRRLIDLWGCDWAPLRADEAGLFVAATCTVATFKIWNMATVGGNLCMALPAGPMISLCTALDGVCVIWTPEGGERRLSIFDFVIDPQH